MTDRQTNNEIDGRLYAGPDKISCFLRAEIVNRLLPAQCRDTHQVPIFLSLSFPPCLSFLSLPIISVSLPFLSFPSSTCPSPSISFPILSFLLTYPFLSHFLPPLPFPILFIPSQLSPFLSFSFLSYPFLPYSFSSFLFVTIPFPSSS